MDAAVSRPSAGPASTPAVVIAAVVALRLVLGAVFVFSGFVKAVDLWGGYYKITEYLLTLGWHDLLPLASFAALLLSAFEFVAGVLLLVGAYRRVVPALLLLFTLAMLPLTYWLASTNAVADCGCFGDAVHLSNWATFWKNVLLAAGLVVLLWLNCRVRGLYGPAVQWVVGVLSLFYVIAIGVEGYLVQPAIDFRPYPEGTALMADAPSTDGNDYLFVYERAGERQTFPYDSLPDEDAGWVFVERVARPAAAAPDAAAGAKQMIPLYLDHEDITADVLSETPSQLLLLFPDLEKVRIASTFGLNELYDYATARGVAVYGVCSASQSQINWWEDISMAEYPMTVTDDSDLKMFARGNPAVVFIENGRIRWKRTLGSLNHEQLHEGSIAQLATDLSPRRLLLGLTAIYLAALAVLLLINRTPVLLMGLFRRKPAPPTEEAAPTDVGEQQ